MPELDETGVDVWGVAVTEDLARHIRDLRVAGATWREIALDTSDRLGQNQIFGRDLCRVSARLLGEEPEEAPWN
jgi:predicted RNA-binding protein with PIN domain